MEAHMTYHYTGPDASPYSGANVNFYAEIGPRLVDLGFSSIPIIPRTKRPGQIKGGAWVGDNEWTRFCLRKPTGLETGIWSKYRDGGVCVVLGYNQVAAVDIDSDDPAFIREIEDAIGQTPVGKVGRRGVTWFFRADADFKTKRFKLANGDGVDLLGPGAQTVIPGTYHPDTGNPYKWREDGDLLERWAPEMLPLLSTDLANVISEIVKPRGWIEPVVHEHARGGGNGVLDGLKTDAMARVSEWLPALGVPVKGSRAVAVWRGGEGYNVNIYHDGFHDFGGGRSEQLSAIDVVMAVGNCTCGEAARWLKERIGYEDPEPEIVHFDFNRRERIEVLAAPRSDRAPASNKLEWLDDMALDLNGQWLIKKLFPRVGVVSVFGDSRSFKTFLLVHVSYCVALGRDFAGFKIKNKGPVIYVAAEDGAGVRKRMLGYHMANEGDLPPRDEIPIAIIDAAPNLGATPGDLPKLIARVERGLREAGGDRPSLIEIDTLNQTLGDAEENTTGMQAFMHNATEIARYFQCSVVAVTHVGHADKLRERGGSQIKGNADSRFLVTRPKEAPDVVDGVKTYETLLSVEKVKNGEDGFGLKATLREIILGRDEDGDNETTLVLTSVERTEGNPAKKSSDKPQSRAATLRRDFLDAYHHLAADAEQVAGFDGKPVRKVPVDAIRRHLIDRGRLDVGADDKLPKKELDALGKVKRSLTEPGKNQAFAESGGQIWILHPERPFSFGSKN